MNVQNSIGMQNSIGILKVMIKYNITFGMPQINKFFYSNFGWELAHFKIDLNCSLLTNNNNNEM